MPIETHVFASGAYRKAKEIFVKDGNVWRDCKEKWVNDNGVWRLVFHKFFEFNADISGYNYNLRAAVMATGQWDGVTPVQANLRVVGNLGSQPPPVPAHNPSSDADFNQLRRARMAEYANYPAFDSGNLPAGSEINLTVLPGIYLVGAGGQGGYGYHTQKESYRSDSGLALWPWFWENGGAGSPAIRTSVKMNITNNGVIGGGGGGGAGSIGAVTQSYWQGKNFNSFTSGGFGGGGAGMIIGEVVPYPTNIDAPRSNFGYPGTLTAGGAGGSVWIVNGGASGTPGGRGGDLGQPGGDGGSRLPLDITGYPQYLRTGGAAGAAVIGSSHVTWRAYGDVRGPLV